MSLKDDLKKDRFTVANIGGIGSVKFRHLRAGELLDRDGGDHQGQILGLILISVYDGERPAFASIDEVTDLPWDTVKALNKEIGRVNGFEKEDLEKTRRLPAPMRDL